MRKTSIALFLLSASEGPLSAADAAKLRDEAWALTDSWAHSGIAYRRQLVGDIRDLIRPLDASDPSVAELHAWLATNDPTWESPVPEAAPVPPTPEPTPPEPAPSVALVLVPVTPAEVAAARGALDAAERVAAERVEAHRQAIETRDAAKTKAAETNNDDDWTRYHAADRAVIQSEALCKHAHAEAARLQEVFAAVLEADRDARITAAFKACDDSALEAVLAAEGVAIRVQIAKLEKALEQIVLRATFDQNRLADEALALARREGLSENEIQRRCIRGEFAADGSARRPWRAVAALLSRLAFAQLAAESQGVAA